jgi:hypothetical protein
MKVSLHESRMTRVESGSPDWRTNLGRLRPKLGVMRDSGGCFWIDFVLDTARRLRWWAGGLVVEGTWCC